jgi:death-on-curing protein
MKRRIQFLGVEHLLAIHRQVIRRFRGRAGLRDPGLLESAAAMPSAQFGGEFLHPTVAAMAAAYLFHVCRNHAFIDGNKRVALVAAEMFLVLNGYRLAAVNDDLERLTLAVADGSLSKNSVIAFFRRHISRA